MVIFCCRIWVSCGKVGRLKHLAAPGIPIVSPIMVTDLIMDGNLGQPFLSQYVVTLDLAVSRLWLTPIA